MKRTPIDDLASELQRLESQSLRRTPTVVPEGAVVMCSNDYLGLGRVPMGGDANRGGATASRLVSGNTQEHEGFEAAVAEWLGVEAALLFTSGYAANVGALGALVRPGDRVLSDALNHASIIDGLRIARANVEIVPHLDVNTVARQLDAPGAPRTWVVTESYFSMDADVPPLPALADLCQRAGAALYVDEAHALGVYGPEGRGICADLGVIPDVRMGALGKAFGLGGAFVAGSAVVRSWLWNKARSFVFSTGLSPAVAAEAHRRLPQIRGADADREHVHRLAAQLREGLRKLGCDVRGQGPIVPWVLSDPAQATALADQLKQRGFFVQAIRPPTVPAGTSRLRLTVTADLHADQVTSFLRAVGEVKESWDGWSS